MSAMPVLSRARARLDRAVAEYLARLGFANHYRSFVHGPPERLHDPKPRRPGVIYNTRSGDIHIGKHAILGHGVMLLTGRHEYADGRLAHGADQVPDSGHDIHIGRGAWVASGAIVLGGVTVGDHAIVAAGAVVTRDVPDHAIVAGIPARVVGSTIEAQAAS
jgi:acetyltransferase-like isoleucine patch superfamily enzyme